MITFKELTTIKCYTLLFLSVTSVAAQSAKKEIQIGLMLLSIVALYLVTYPPYACLLASQSYLGWADTSFFNALLFQILMNCAIVLTVLNHSLNFCTYCISSQMFRRAAKDTLTHYVSYIRC